jgi:hypothetical protein
VAGVESSATVSRSDDDSNARFTYVEMSETMEDRDASDVPGAADEDTDLFSFFSAIVSYASYTRCNVRFPFELFAHDAFEDADCSVLWTQEFSGDSCASIGSRVIDRALQDG